MKAAWTQGALQDLIGRFVGSDDPSAARRLTARLKTRATRAARFPYAGRIVPEFEREDIREFVEGNYRIVYRVLRRHIHILIVFEGHRQLPRERAERTPNE
jgi:toxin ParE1/3/4